MARHAKNLLSPFMRKLRTVWRLPIGLTALAALAWLLLWPARLAVLTVPLRHMVRTFGKDQGVSPAIPLISDAQLEKAQGVARAIALAARYSPQSANCYPQALVARLLLRFRRIPHALFFGVRRDPDSAALEAHAWIMAGPLAVTGGHSFGRFTVVRSFLTGPG